MSRLEELIQELCPDGVEYKSLGEVCKLVTGATPSKTRKEYWENGTIPWMSSGEVNNKRIFATESKITQKGYDCTSTTIVPIHSVVIALAGQGKTRGKVAITEIELCTNLSLCSMICNESNESLDYRFLYYYLDGKYEELRAISNGDGTRGGLSIRILTPYKIPVPPLPVQIEIVRILDNLTELAAELEENLTAELTARKKQYRYYMDMFLTTEGTEHSLEDVCLIVDCPHTSPKWKEFGVPVIRNYNLSNGVIDTTNLSYVDEEEYKIRIKRITPQENDVLFSREAPIGNVGIIPKGFRCCQGQRVVLLRPKKDVVFPKFLLYVLQSGGVHEQIVQVGKIGSTVSNFNISDLKKLRLTIPPIGAQMNISEKLDAFSNLCADIFEGLSVEIEARQKQYEF